MVCCATIGPVNIHDRVLRAMNVPGQNHRDPWFAELYKSVLEDTKFVFQTRDGTPFIFPGTGTGGWEAALCNTLSPGDKVVCFRYGLFSHLWIDMMQRLGLDVTVIDCPWGEGADEGRLEEILRKDTNKTIKAVCVVHNETTTGVTSDIHGCRQAMDAASHPALLLVDGVSSIGALDFQFDKWRVDVAVTGSQKAMSLPTGLAYVCASKKVRHATFWPLSTPMHWGLPMRRLWGCGMALHAGIQCCPCIHACSAAHGHVAWSAAVFPS